MMVADGQPVDGSWELTITVTDLQVERTLRVKGDLHIGGLMLQLVDALDIALDWSDHALWWPDKNRWLKRTRSTLDQYGVQADAVLHFTPMHKNVRLQLPDLQIIDMRTDFSMNVFSVVIRLCKELGIRHPEELSLMLKLDKGDLKRNVKKKAREAREASNSPTTHLQMDGQGFITPTMNGSFNTSTLSNRSSGFSPSPQGTLTPGSPYRGSNSQHNTINGTLSPGSMHSLTFESNIDAQLSNSPVLSAKEALAMLYKPHNFAEKASINCAWLDSSCSLMEQGVRENDGLILKYKFYSYYDLNPKYDSVRINQIYEQAKWSLISEEIDCTEEEMMMFAALQVQVQLQVHVPQPELDHTDANEDDVDAALKDLQESLEGNTISAPGDITHIPELGDYLRYLKPKKFQLKGFKQYWCTFRDTHITLYANKDEMNSGTHLKNINVRSCEALPDVNISAEKFNIKLFVPSVDGMSEILLKCESENQYARWMAACKMAAKGKTMADSSYESEVQALQTFLSMQHPAPNAAISPSQLDIQAEDFIAPRFFKKLKARQLIQRIMEAHTNVRDMSLLESKLAYIKAWQALTEYGITYFIIRMKGSKKEELLGVANNRIIRMDLTSGDSLKTWRFNTMKSWNVNWEVRHVILDFEEDRVEFSSLSADCKIVHEFIGGYIFLTTRSQDKNQALNEEMFHKLTGGWQ